MLSLQSGRKVAIIDGDKKNIVYLKDEDGKEPEIETKDEHKIYMFNNYLELDKKLSHLDIEKLNSCYKRHLRDGSNSEDLGKLSRKYHEAKKYVSDSLKKHLDYSSTKHKLFPIIDEDSFRVFVSGLSGSGKSYFINEFLKYNKPRCKEAGIFLFSPVKEDKAFKGIKNLIHLDLDELFEEMKGKELEVEDIPDGSIVIFDDIESFPKGVAKKYMNLRDIFLERGRGHKEGQKGISTICVSHNAMNGHSTKISIREAQYWCLFPKFNSRDTKAILKLYGGLENDDITHIMNMKSRWCFYRKSVPKYAVGEHSVISFT